MLVVQRMMDHMQAAIAVAVLSTGVCAENSPAKPRYAATPEQAVEFLLAAAQADDLPGALDQIAAPFHDVMEWFILQEEAEDAVRAALDDRFGFRERAGFRMEVKRDLLGINSIQILSQEVISESRVKLRVRETRQSFHHDQDDVIEWEYLALRENGRWKLLRTFTALYFGNNEFERANVTQRRPDGQEVPVFNIKSRRELDEIGRDYARMWKEELQQPFPEALERSRRSKEFAEQAAADVAAGKYQTRMDALTAIKQAARHSGVDSSWLPFYRP